MTKRSERTQADREMDWATGRELERKDAEIERLRAALKQISDQCTMLPIGSQYVAEIATRALAGDEQLPSNAGHSAEKPR